jgi:hypothetical protein
MRSALAIRYGDLSNRGGSWGGGSVGKLKRDDPVMRDGITVIGTALSLMRANEGRFSE